MVLHASLSTRLMSIGINLFPRYRDPQELKPSKTVLTLKHHDVNTTLKF